MVKKTNRKKERKSIREHMIFKKTLHIWDDLGVPIDYTTYIVKGKRLYTLFSPKTGDTLSSGIDGIKAMRMLNKLEKKIKNK